jgi:hypothetical protein
VFILGIYFKLEKERRRGLKETKSADFSVHFYHKIASKFGGR